MFIGGKARSGVIVLPCGAGTKIYKDYLSSYIYIEYLLGKTLVGIVAATTIKKRTIIFCNTDLAIQQWEGQLKLYTDINANRILKLSSKYLEDDKLQKCSKEA